MRVGQLNRAVKADEISVVEPTQPLRLARQSKDNWGAGLLSHSLILASDGQGQREFPPLLYLAIR